MRTSIIACLFAVAALSAQASYLQWQVSTSQVEGLQEWDTATFYEVDVDGTKTALKTAQAIDGEVGPVTVDLGDLTTKTGYGYYIELVNNSSSTPTLSGYQQGTYASLAESVTTSLDVENLQAQVWHGGSYNAPEPTSAMLMLLGVAGLALRRKQRKLNEV